MAAEMECRPMSISILDHIPFEPDIVSLKERLRIRDANSYSVRLEQLLHEAQTVARPKALYKVALIDEKGEDYVLIDGVRFNSRVLRINLDEVHRVFPYVATCGTELKEWADELDDMLESYWADVINELALRAAVATLNAHLAERYQPGQTATMNPGSLGEWPLREQRALFQLLEDPESTIGVQLTKSCLMVPSKSVSGIQFPTASGFFNCQLCPRVECPNRRAPYEPELYETKYQLTQ
jgi:hypothetical protein